MNSMDWGTLPDAKELEATGDFPMVIKSQDEWSVIAAAINQGIDSRLEIVGTVVADHTTGEITIEAKWLHTFLRRLLEAGNEGSDSLAGDIMSVLGYDWV